MGVTSDWDNAVVNRLKADAPLSAIVTGVYAGVAPQVDDSGDPLAFPYLIIDDTDFVDYHTGLETALKSSCGYSP